MDQIELNTTNREILGKKVRFLRRQGITPVHLFGHGIESVALQCDTTELKQALVEAGYTRLINLKLDNEKRPRAVVVRKVQKEPLTGESLHVDFFQVRAEEKVRVEVPVVMVGEAPASDSKENILVQELSTLTVECLPAKIPTGIELDISSLTDLGQTIRVKDIELGRETTILSDPEMVVVRIRTRRIEKVEEEEKEEVAAEEVIEAPAASSLPELEPREE